MSARTEDILRVAIVLVPQFSLLPLGGFLDALRHAADDEDFSRQRFCHWQLCSFDGQAVTASCGACLTVDAPVSHLDARDLDYLVIHAGRLQGIDQLADTDIAQLQRFATVTPLVGLDSGSFVLARGGLMDGYTAAIHWRHLADYVARFERAAAVSDQLYLFDRDRISCPGGASAIELAVALISQKLGRHRALKGMADLQIEGPRQYAPVPAQPPVADNRLAKALELLRQNPNRAHNAHELAVQVGISARQLDRLCQRNFNMSINAYDLQRRLQLASKEIEAGKLSFAQIADQTGFCDVAHLIRQFRRKFHETPGAMRKRISQPQK